MQPNVPKLIELVIEKGVSNALADDHDDLSDEQRTEMYTRCVMDALNTGFSFLEYEDEEDEYDDE